MLTFFVRQMGGPSHRFLAGELPFVFGSDTRSDVIVAGVPAVWFRVLRADLHGVQLEIPDSDSLLNGKRRSQHHITSRLGLREFFQRRFVRTISLGDIEVRMECALPALVPSWGSLLAVLPPLRSPGSSRAPSLKRVLLSKTVMLRAGGTALTLAGIFWLVQSEVKVADAFAPLPRAAARASGDKLGAVDGIEKQVRGPIPIFAPIEANRNQKSDSRDPAMARLREVMLRSGVRADVGIMSTSTGIVVTGVLSPSEAQKLRYILSHLEGTDGTHFINSTTEEFQKIDVRVRAVSVDPGFIDVDPGRRILVGQIVKDGWVLKAVSHDAITLDRNGASQIISRH